MRLAMTVEYDGTEYSGFQYQKNVPTVQQQIEKAIEALTAEAVRIKAAGRTDAGVHALGQVAAFDTEAQYPTSTVQRALNARLPQDVAIRAVYRVRPNFDPRRDATSRLYRYCLRVAGVRSPMARRTSHTLRGPLDLDSMRAAASLMEGTRDFANFGGTPETPNASTVRRVDRVSIDESGRFIRIEVEGNAFLPHQVRRMAGALVDVGMGRLTIEHIHKQISGAKDAPPTRSLPSQGLCLVEVRYDDFPP